MTARPRFVCRGGFALTAPPERAFPLFTAAGERLWVPGWSPEFLADVDDDTAPGTVWRTSADGRETTWIVVESIPPTAATYARFTPGHSATRVRVRLERTDAGTRVDVGYDITSLDEAADALLEQFAQDFDEMLLEWQRGTSAVLAGEDAASVS
ncbi:SRPBCC domain-containing protein [Microbacterium sp. SS28]|uniref:SRPBCC family protein n=1 Tax=Microbacterium sp. SS28 TaxID=2919948 RepID=UPI001FAA9F41|nr:hypothetical protein [Microbacterium sp. SS28]